MVKANRSTTTAITAIPRAKVAVEAHGWLGPSSLSAAAIVPSAPPIRNRDAQASQECTSVRYTLKAAMATPVAAIAAPMEMNKAWQLGTDAGWQSPPTRTIEPVHVGMLLHHTCFAGAR